MCSRTSRRGSRDAPRPLPRRTNIAPRRARITRLRRRHRRLRTRANPGALDMRAGELGLILGVSSVDVMYLEQGSMTLSEKDWARVFEAVRAVRKGRG